MSVDTYLKGKNLDPYLSVSDGEVEVLLSPHLVRWASELNLDVRKRLVGRKLVAVARLDNTPDAVAPPPAVTAADVPASDDTTDTLDDDDVATEDEERDEA